MRTVLLNVLVSVLMLATGAASAHQESRRILILGASISWGCVEHCEAIQVEKGYVERLRLLMPDDEIRVQAWFGSGIADWDPESVPILDQSLEFPVGVWEEGLGHHVNLWNLLAIPELCSWRPDCVILVAGLGDVLRFGRTPPRPITDPEEYEAGVERIASGILRSGATPVLAVDTPFSSLLTFFDDLLDDYAQSIEKVCDERKLRCGPDLRDVVDREADFVGTDDVHPNASGHQAIAEAFADWFDGEHRRSGRNGRGERFCRHPWGAGPPF